MPNGQHPAVSESLRRLAALERRTLPGYPLGYKLQRHYYACAGCGASASFAILLTVRRTGGNGKGYALTGLKEIVYDLPVETTDTHFSTPRCEACITALPREAVPKCHEYKEKLYKGRDAPKAEAEIDLEALGLL